MSSPALLAFDPEFDTEHNRQGDRRLRAGHIHCYADTILRRLVQTFFRLLGNPDLEQAVHHGTPPPYNQPSIQPDQRCPHHVYTSTPLLARTPRDQAEAIVDLPILAGLLHDRLRRSQQEHEFQESIQR